jgi:hypothetical protein
MRDCSPYWLGQDEDRLSEVVVNSPGLVTPGCYR